MKCFVISVNTSHDRELFSFQSSIGVGLGERGLSPFFSIGVGKGTPFVVPVPLASVKEREGFGKRRLIYGIEDIDIQRNGAEFRLIKAKSIRSNGALVFLNVRHQRDWDTVTVSGLRQEQLLFRLENESGRSVEMLFLLDDGQSFNVRKTKVIKEPRQYTAAPEPKKHIWSRRPEPLIKTVQIAVGTQHEDQEIVFTGSECKLSFPDPVVANDGWVAPVVTSTTTIAATVSKQLTSGNAAIQAAALEIANESAALCLNDLLNSFELFQARPSDEGFDELKQTLCRAELTSSDTKWGKVQLSALATARDTVAVLGHARELTSLELDWQTLSPVVFRLWTQVCLTVSAALVDCGHPELANS